MTYTAIMGGTCGISLRNISEGYGELTLFFDKQVSLQTRFQFEAYVRTHLQRRALSESIRRRRIFICPKCEEPFTESQIMHRRGRGFDSIMCSVCETQVSILDREEGLTGTMQTFITEMDRAANNQRERETALSTIQGKLVISDFDVFLCHNSEDKPKIKKIGEQLKQYGILPWLDAWELQSGIPWQHLLEQQIGRIRAAAVFVGSKGVGPWQQQELEALLREFVNRICPVIPVILPGTTKVPDLPIFLKGMTWVDFRKRKPDPMEQLIWGVTGKRVIVR